jgi:hypothetical protein
MTVLYFLEDSWDANPVDDLEVGWQYNGFALNNTTDRLQDFEVDWDWGDGIVKQLKDTIVGD